ncbi:MULTISPECIES: winged helix-turn-helix domain-containing protein [Vibrio]|uniref:Winged helix-turn-helix domain-containing protein n=1 Tax=bacterium 19MO03SA05 TaxID=2920620 RepID=A0AAU6VFL9_UNCXX|nr:MULTISPECIES: winged helix-turn-helix domain-containing protein [Vibrio]EKO3666657.1 winged helix-turn-helix domain-containing protein [Vibrio metschnikovii]EKO3707879.1 winged helix-turn-helix domain-containing protein [Vibrio metschnikovii]EKO3895318.1 winged helix-turn-helix domain-containing protein [Vibrio metschnikovii]EKO3922267.1 winged helix-turn-helix domain-containing protein [Vibrio metschnikovii]MDQ2109508.1 hypothetical protein [Vibrio sp. 2017_1457_15]
MLNRIYLINNFIFFDVISGKLWARDDQTLETTEVTVNTPVRRCLQLLIEKQGQVIPHDEFFEFVWRKNGLEVSPNSFYQNISLLRRALKSFNINDEVIITIPKQGIILPSRVTISIVGDQSVEAPVEDQAKKTNLLDTSKRRSALPIISATITICLLLLTIVLYSSSPTMKDFSIKFSEIEVTPSGCHIYFNKDERNYERHYDTLRKLSPNCSVIDQTEFYDQKPLHYFYVVTYDHVDRTTIYQCEKPMTANNRDNFCLSRYFVLGSHRDES